jgi:hypothetical protein
VSCGVWPLPANVSFEQVKVGLTLVSKLKVPLPRFPLSREDEEDDACFLVRVEQEARNIVGNYMCVEHEAYVNGLPHNGWLNRVLELPGVAYGPRPVPAPAEVLKKRKEEASGEVLANRRKAPEKKGTESTKVSRACTKGGMERPLGADILPTKSMKLSKGIIPRVIATVAVACIMPVAHGSVNLINASGSKASRKYPGYKTVPGVKKAAPSARNHIVSAIRALAMISSQGTQESSQHD